MPSTDLTMKEFEQLGICENELLKTIVSNEKEIIILKALLNSQQLTEHNGKLQQMNYMHAMYSCTDNCL